MSESKLDHLFKDKVLGHPAGLFCPVFYRNGEQFSFYGMRAFAGFIFTAPLLNEKGWAWPYTGLASLYHARRLFCR